MGLSPGESEWPCFLFRKRDWRLAFAKSHANHRFITTTTNPICDFGSLLDKKKKEGKSATDGPPGRQRVKAQRRVLAIYHSEITTDKKSYHSPVLLTISEYSLMDLNRADMKLYRFTFPITSMNYGGNKLWICDSTTLEHLT